MALSPEQIAAQIEDLGRELVESFGDVVLEAANRVIEDVVKPRMNFENNSADGVMATIQATFDEATMTLGVRMPEHGYFQNFGVIGLDGNPGVMGLDENTADAFGVSGEYEFRFGTGSSARNNPPRYWGIHYPGIKAKNFLQLEDFTDRVVQLINENLEL